MEKRLVRNYKREIRRVSFGKTKFRLKELPMNECPNCQSTDISWLTTIDFNKDKMCACMVCGTRFNPGEEKEKADIPEEVNTPEKLQDFVAIKSRADAKLKSLLNGRMK